MTNVQLYLTIGIPVVSNAIIFAIFLAFMNRSLDSLRNEMVARFERADTRMSSMENRIETLRSEFNTRFLELKELWRAELRRVEEVIDARLKHLEER